MTFRNRIKIAGALTLLGIVGFTGRSVARENIVTAHHKGQQKTAASQCLPATAEIDLDINNVRAHLMTGGDMWWNRNTEKAAYEVPKGSGKSSQFAASCWIGGYDQQGQLKVAAQTYRQDGNDYWPGALNADGEITPDACSNWDNFWKVDRSTINKFIQMSKSGGASSSAEFDVIYQWPASGNTKSIGKDGTRVSMNPNSSYAPYVDVDGNGIYTPKGGDYPDIRGDQYIWWVFNDKGNVKQQSGTAAIGVEVQTSAFAYATQDFLNDATFCNYRVINRGALTMDSTYIAVWDDADLGYYLDDYIGCDTGAGLGILYNGTNDDGVAGGHPVNSYGLNPPQVGLDFFQGPRKPIHHPGLPDTYETLKMTNFTYFNNDASIIGNPSNGTQIYYYMTGSIKSGQRFSDDFQGPGIPSKGYGGGPISNSVFWGDPGNNSEWSECACNNTTGDRRFIFSSGPFQLLPGAVSDITFGCVWAKGVGGCGATSFKAIKSIDKQAQDLFDNHFKTVEGPEAPRMVVRELDRKLIFYLVNDYGSNNFGENYGRADGVYGTSDSAKYRQRVVKSTTTDTLYHFEGYRVFQLANSQVTPAEIFNPTTGEVDNSKAYEVFQCDIINGVTQISNFVKNINVVDTPLFSDGFPMAQIKVNGKDSGITHSFVLTQDQFANGTDKKFINYHNYYFVAIAYGYNNFAGFNPMDQGHTQEKAYIASSHGAGGTEVPKVIAMPNPSNGNMGTVLNADYGSGVVITRVEGVGNGGHVIQLDEASEDIAVASGVVDKAVYMAGQGPIDVKVIDPLVVPDYNWVLQIEAPAAASSDSAGIPAATWKLTGIRADGSVADTIYSERSIGSLNEQIIEKYGLSVAVQQVKTPGTTDLSNGYITSDISFENSSLPWLAGVEDKSDSSFANWLRAGSTKTYNTVVVSETNPCWFNDNVDFTTAVLLDPNANYNNMFANFTPTKSSWGPYVLVAPFNPVTKHFGTGTQCGMQAAYSDNTQTFANFKKLPDINLVFTSDKSKWTRCAVIEEQEDTALSERSATKFSLRKHAGWNLGWSGDNTPIYEEDAAHSGMSWFPGYAVDQNTGQRLNIVFGEDSYLSSDNGNDMLWNPTFRKFSDYDLSILFGGKHIIYVLGTKYDSDRVFVSNVKLNTANALKAAYGMVQWLGMPLLNEGQKLTSIKEGIIPTKTTLRFRVKRPYAPYAATDTTTSFTAAGVSLTPGHKSFPYYTFNTSELVASKLTDTSNRNKLLDRINVVPNPYYGYSGFESNRYDTKVRIINLPPQATIRIYSMDGSLVRTITKNSPNVSYVDWDIRNTAGLPIASGVYMMHVNAVGIGERVIKWFGATRPLDVTQY